jgi:hypothetical protein
MIVGKGGNQLDTIQMDFTARRFDTFSEVFAIEYYDSDGILQEVDLTGATAQMQLKKRKSDATPFFNMDIAISGNKLTVSKNHLMMDLPAGKYWYDIEIKDSSGDHITWVQGRFVVVEHITEFVDTILTYVSTTFNSILTIFNVPKITFVSSFIDNIIFKNIVVYRLKAFWNTALKFTTINFIVKKVTVIFLSTLTIMNVPKIFCGTVFRVIVNMTNYLRYTGTINFNIRVIFYEVD